MLLVKATKDLYPKGVADKLDALLKQVATTGKAITVEECVDDPKSGTRCFMSF